jgi:hypothetical protein
LAACLTGVKFLLYTLGDGRLYLQKKTGIADAEPRHHKEQRMLSDLIRALPAVVLVGVVPGWFWAKLLIAPADHAERFAYSVALSITLVPTAALVQARLLGTGVTLAIAIVSVVLVFFGGLAAYLRFGPAKEPNEPLVQPPASLGLPVLVPLIAAFALILGALFGLVSAKLGAPLAALLVLSGGIARLLASSRQDTTWAAGRPTGALGSSVAPAVHYAALSAVLLLVLLRGYLGPLLHDWPYPRGVDRYEHAVMTGMTLSEGTTESFMLYPPGLHFLTALISRLSGFEPLDLFPVVAPLLLLLPALGCYALARRLWGWEYGVVAAFLSGLILGSTYLHFAEARYANFIGTQFLIVLAVAALVGLYASPSVRAGLLLALLGSSTVLYHQIASYSLAVLLALVGVFFLPYLLLRDRRRGLALFCSLALLGLLSTLYAWDTYDLPRLVAGLVSGSETGRGGEAVAMAIGTQAPYSLGSLAGNMVSQPVAWLGLLGTLLVAGELLRKRLRAPQTLAYLTLLLLTLLLFVGSRTSLSGFPQRFGRDLGIPLAVLGAFAFAALFRSLLGSRKQVAAVFVASLTVLLAATLVGVGTVSSLESASGPSVQMTITPEIAAAGEWLREHNEGGNILVSPHINQVPSRMMLAMGGYSALQSFEAWQIDRPRDLPPTGPGPLRDVLWVITHPKGERTDQILQKHDVRYIVLYKNMPDRPTIDYWKSFKARPNLYRTVFENEDVLITTRRETTPAD